MPPAHVRRHSRRTQRAGIRANGRTDDRVSSAPSARRHSEQPLSAVIYRGALSGGALSADGCRGLFRRHSRQGMRVNGVFPILHYQTHSHEVLGCLAGSARVAFGGDHGVAADFMPATSS